MLKQFLLIRLNTLERLVHALKTALACIIGFIVAEFVHSPFDLWLVITIIVVMCAQLSVGSMLQKSYMRFLGTVAGSLIAVITLKFFGDRELPIALAVSFSAMAFSFIATSEQSYNEAGALGAVTVAIILLGNSPTIAIAGLRFIEITLGIVIAALVSSFVFPIQAKNHLRRVQAKTIRQLGEFYEKILLESPEACDKEVLQDLDESIIASLLKQRKLTKEVVREVFNKKTALEYFKQILWCERNILRCINFILLARESSPTIKPYLLSSEVSKQLFQQIRVCFHEIAICLASGEYTAEKIIVPDIKASSLLADIKVVNPSVEESLAIDTTIFLMEQLVDYLRQLAALMERL